MRYGKMFRFRMRRRGLPRFVAMAKPYWFSEDKWIARGLLAPLVILLRGNTAFVPDTVPMSTFFMS